MQKEITEKINDEATIGKSPGRPGEVAPPIGRQEGFPDTGGDEIASVGVGVAKVEHGREVEVDGQGNGVEKGDDADGGEELADIGH